MIVTAIKCKKCGDTVFSRAQHDCRHCSCGACFIDGGSGPYWRIGGEPADMKMLKLKVVEDKLTLYRDWNYKRDKFGLIKPEVKRAKTKV